MSERTKCDEKLLLNLKIGTKLIAAFASIIVLYIFTVFISLHTIQNMSGKMNDFYNQPFANVEASMSMLSNLHLVGKNLTIMAATDNVMDEDELMMETKSASQEVEKSWRSCRPDTEVIQNW